MNLLTIVLMAAPEGGKGGFPWPMIIMMIAVFYFFMILPQSRRNKKMKAFREEVVKGTEIVTSGGIYGKIIQVNDDTFVIETEGHGKLKIQKTAISLEATQALAKQEESKSE